MPVWWAYYCALALALGLIVDAQSVTPPPSANVCGECTIGQPHYAAGWWTNSAISSSLASVEAITVMIYTINGTNQTRTSTIFNFPPGAEISNTNSDGYVLHTQTLTYGATTTTTVLTWPTGYVGYQDAQQWFGTMPVTVGQGLNATRTCSTAPSFPTGAFSSYPTPFPPAYPTPIKGAGGGDLVTDYNPNMYYMWYFQEGGHCQMPYAESYVINYVTATPDFPVYQTCWTSDSSECGAAAMQTVQYLTVTSTAADTQTTSTSSSTTTELPAPKAHTEQTVPTNTPSPAATTSAGPLKTSSLGPVRESQAVSSESSGSGVALSHHSSSVAETGPTASSVKGVAFTSTSAESPLVSSSEGLSESSTVPLEPETRLSSTATSFHITTDEAGTTVAIVPGTNSEEQTTFSSFSTTTDNKGETVAVVQPSAPRLSSSTATAFRVTTDGSGSTVAVVGPASGDQATFTSFHTTTNAGGQTVVVVQSSISPIVSTITSFQLTTNRAGSTVAVIPQTADVAKTYTSFHTTTGEAGQTVAIVQVSQPVIQSSTATVFQLTTNAAGSLVAVVGSGAERATTYGTYQTTTDQAGHTVVVIQLPASSSASLLVPETLTTNSMGQTAAFVDATTTIPLTAFTAESTSAGRVVTLTGSAAIPNSGGKPFLYTSGNIVVAATPTTDASGHTVIVISSQSAIPVITDSAGSSFALSVFETSTTITAPFTYTSDGLTTTITPSRGHSVVTFHSTTSIPIAPTTTASSSTDVGGYVASGIGATASNGQNSVSATSSPTTTGGQQSNTGSSALPRDMRVLIAVVALIGSLMYR